jgi:hypothetical protein
MYTMIASVHGFLQVPARRLLVQHFKLCDQREWLRSFLVGGSHPPFTVMLQLGVDAKAPE